jgi:hypothetical protein
MRKLVRFGCGRHVLVIGMVVKNVVFHFTRVQKFELTVWALMNDDLALHVLVVAWRRGSRLRTCGPE